MPSWRKEFVWSAVLAIGCMICFFSTARPLDSLE
jgi:hypothetical protein